jgi:hypothetical protein
LTFPHKTRNKQPLTFWYVALEAHDGYLGPLKEERKVTAVAKAKQPLKIKVIMQSLLPSHGSHWHMNQQPIGCCFFFTSSAST